MEDTIPFYRYFEHEADAGIMAEGKTLEESFACGAQAMFEMICDPMQAYTQNYQVSVSSEDLLSLWIDFLNKLLAEMDIHGVFFLKCNVKKIEKSNDGYSLLALMQGVARNKIQICKSEVKAATYCMAAVERTEEGYRVQCVLDV